MLRAFLAFGLSLAAVAQAAEPRLAVPVDDEYPALSPDGEWIAFESRRADGVDHIFVSRTDGSELRQLTVGPHDDETPVFSPDGERIVFARLLGEGRDAHLDIFVIDRNGDNLRNLSNDPRGQDDHPKFSADGKTIVFNSSRATPFASLSDEAFENYGWNYDIWEMDADGANPRPLVELANWDTYPSLSPDGARLLWRRVLVGGGERNSEIFIADADGENRRNITNDPAFDGYPAFSPDGEWIVFASNRDSDGDTFRLYAMRPDGSEVTRLTDPAAGVEDVRPSWGPDGRTLVFNRDYPARDGGDSRILLLTVEDHLAVRR